MSESYAEKIYNEIMDDYRLNNTTAYHKDIHRALVRKLDTLHAKAMELAEFYADKDNWMSDEYNDDVTITPDDWYELTVGCRDYMGGKKARAFVEEFKNG